MSFTEATIADLLTINLLKTGHQDLALATGALSYRLLDAAIKKNGIGVAQSTWNVSTTIGAVLMGIILYKEEIGEKKIVGIILGIAGVYLMNS